MVQYCSEMSWLKWAKKPKRTRQKKKPKRTRQKKKQQPKLRHRSTIDKCGRRSHCECAEHRRYTFNWQGSRSWSYFILRPHSVLQYGTPLSISHWDMCNALWNQMKFNLSVCVCVCVSAAQAWKTMKNKPTKLAAVCESNETELESNIV